MNETIPKPAPPEDGWHAVALGEAIPAGATRAVVLGGHELVLWRDMEGSLHAWNDRCPHRGMRLSYGFVRGTTLNCLYHGWSYSATSNCLRIPAHPDLAVPPSIRATAYHIDETGPLVFICRDKAPHAHVPRQPRAGLPIVSIGIDCPVDLLRREIRQAAFTPFSQQGTEHEFETHEEGTLVSAVAFLAGGSYETLLLAGHAVTAERSMLHVAIDAPAADDAAALRRHYTGWARRLRDSIEAGTAYPNARREELTA